MKRKEQSTMITTDAGELRKEIRTLRTRIASLAVGRTTKPSKNVREMKNIRNRLATILTIVRQKELAHG